MNGLTDTLKTFLLLTVLSALFLVIGYAAGGRDGMTAAFFLSLGMNFFSYWFSDKMVLAAHRATELAPGDSVYGIVEELAQKAGIPMPRVYLVPNDAPNAFATGRSPKHAAVAVTQGLVRLLNEREVRAVLAHELGHVKNRDILVSTIAATLASAVMYLAHMLRWTGGFRREGRGGANGLVLLFAMVLAPLAAMLVQFAVSRSREFLADETGAGISADPLSLASALKKISDPIAAREDAETDAEMRPAFSHLYIVNHLSLGSAANWFSTHPPVAQRVARLERLAGR